VTIITDVPHSISWDDLLLAGRNDEEIKSLFTEFEFNSLGKRLFGKVFESGRGHNSSQHSTSTDQSSNSPELIQAELKTLKDISVDYNHNYLSKISSAST